MDQRHTDRRATNMSCVKRHYNVNTALTVKHVASAYSDAIYFPVRFTVYLSAPVLGLAKLASAVLSGKTDITLTVIQASVLQYSLEANLIAQ